MRYAIRLLSAAVTFCCLNVMVGYSAQEVESVRFGEVTVVRPTVLRSKPGTAGQVRLMQVPKGMRLRWVEGENRNGFFRVIAPKGKQGWIPISAVHIERQLPVLLAASPPCAQTLNACPETGCSQRGSKHALFDQTKRRLPPARAPIVLNLADFASLQEQANDLVDQGLELSSADRAKLSDLHVSQGVVSEGTLVRAIGFIAQRSDPHANSGESVNCRRTELESNDFHISFVNKPHRDEFGGIVVEMIPQGRPANWTIGRLKNLKQHKRLIMVDGAIFYDNAHVVNSDRENPLRGQPRRFSLWEIHPITRFLFCKKANNRCNPNNSTDWTPLEAR